MIPNLFIPGARDSATKHLATTLAGHPEVYMGREREPELFTRAEADAGEQYPDHAGERWVMDASQSYLAVADVLPRIDEACADPRFIIVLRHPVERAHSAYRHLSADEQRERRSVQDILPKNLDEMGLDELVSWEAGAVGAGLEAGSVMPGDAHADAAGFPYRYFWVGRYAEQIARYRALFPRDSFLFLTHEQVTNDFDATLREVGRFLGIDAKGFPATPRPRRKAAAPSPAAPPEQPTRNVPTHRTPSGKPGLALHLARRVTRRLSGVLPPGVAAPARKRIKELLGETPAPMAERTVHAPPSTSDASRGAGFQPADERTLRRIFVPEIERTEALTSLDLSAWK